MDLRLIVHDFCPKEHVKDDKVVPISPLSPFPRTQPPGTKAPPSLEIRVPPHLTACTHRPLDLLSPTVRPSYDSKCHPRANDHWVFAHPVPSMVSPPTEGPTAGPLTCPPAIPTTPELKMPSRGHDALVAHPHPLYVDGLRRYSRSEPARPWDLRDQGMAANGKIPVAGTTEVRKTVLDEKTKSYHCRTCGKCFVRKSGLIRHERIHLGIRPNVCSICNKQFLQKSALTVHLRVHTGEKPYSCKVCHRPFSDSSSLARHRRIHLRESK